MPTIELVSIDCPSIPDLPRYPSFAYRMEDHLVSHRALFQSVFDTLSGVIVHLANKDMEGEDGIWFACDIVDWVGDRDNRPMLLFLPPTRTDVRDLMQRLLAASPQRQITFSTDLQGGGKVKKGGTMTITEFFALHDRRLLTYNTLYYIRPEEVTK